MTIRSLHSVGGILFGASREALSQLGTPLHESVNQLGEVVLDFGQVIYRFAEDRLVEISFPLPSVIDIDGQQIEGNALLSHLEQQDPGFREVHGFAIAPKFGLAVDLDHDDHWTTAFAAGRWDDIT